MLNITIFRVRKALEVEFKDENNNFQGVFKVGNFLTRKDFQTYYLWLLLKISQHILVWDSELGGELIIYIIIYLILTHSIEQLPILGSFKKGYSIQILWHESHLNMNWKLQIIFKVWLEIKWQKFPVRYNILQTSFINYFLAVALSSTGKTPTLSGISKNWVHPNLTFFSADLPRPVEGVGEKHGV